MKNLIVSFKINEIKYKRLNYNTFFGLIHTYVFKKEVTLGVEHPPPPSYDTGPYSKLSIGFEKTC